MYIGILLTYYEIYATGKNKKAVQERIVKGYKDFYREGERQFENPTFDDLNDYFGCRIFKMNKEGYAHE